MMRDLSRFFDIFYHYHTNNSPIIIYTTIVIFFKSFFVVYIMVVNKNELTLESDTWLRNIFTESTNVKKLREFSNFIKNNLTQFDRRAQIKITYPYEILVCVIILARMAGNTTKDDIHFFWYLNNESINKIFPVLFGQIPSPSTIDRIRRAVDTAFLKNKMTKIFGNQYNFFRRTDGSYFATELSLRDVIGCDGQAIRATARTRESDGRLTGSMDITSLVSYRTGITLGQSIHTKKNQEAKAIIDIVENVDIKNAILTWDALNTQEDTFKAAIGKGADVFACLKDNQGNLFEECITAYEEYKKGNILFAQTSSQQIADYSCYEGGKYITKKIVVLDAKDCISKKLLDRWYFIKSVSFIETETTNLISNKKTESFRIFISTIPLDIKKYPEIAKDFLDISLKRWCVETMHWHLDKCFDQDGDSFESIDSAYCSTMISKMVMSVFNFAKNAYSNEELRYKGVCTTTRLQTCSSISFDFSVLLLEAFCKNDPKLLVEHELSRDLKFMKTYIEKDKPAKPKTINTIFKECPLLKYTNTKKYKRKAKAEKAI